MASGQAGRGHTDVLLGECLVGWVMACRVAAMLATLDFVLLYGRVFRGTVAPVAPALSAPP